VRLSIYRAVRVKPLNRYFLLMLASVLPDAFFIIFLLFSIFLQALLAGEGIVHFTLVLRRGAAKKSVHLTIPKSIRSSGLALRYLFLPLVSCI